MASSKKYLVLYVSVTNLSIIGIVEGSLMTRVNSGSIVFMIIGLLWLMGIMGTIMYAIGSQVYTLVLLREIQMRAWVAVESGLLIGLAHVRDNPTLYYQKEGTWVPSLLYSGDWPLDPRHPLWHFTLEVLEGEISKYIAIKGTLSEKGNQILSYIWHLEYVGEQWFFARGERVDTT